MTQIAAIRTHKWTDAEARLLEQLRSAGFAEVCVVFHNRAPGIEPPCDVVDLSAEWAQSQGLRATHDWGWRCGDYFFYALRAAKPGYDHYWLVEPDVFFLGEASTFFSRFDGVEADLLGLDPEPIVEHSFATTMPNMDHYRAIFALTRLSGRALDRLLPLRVENCKVPIGKWRFANDEVFVYSHAMADESLSVGNLRDHAPDWFEGAQFDTAPDILEDAARANSDTQGKVLHPVHGKTAFKSEVAKRLISRVNFLRKLEEGWDHLTDADLKDIAEEVRDRALQTMRECRHKRQKALRRAERKRTAE